MRNLSFTDGNLGFHGMALKPMEPIKYPWKPTIGRHGSKTHETQSNIKKKELRFQGSSKACENLSNTNGHLRFEGMASKPLKHIKYQWKSMISGHGSEAYGKLSNIIGNLGFGKPGIETMNVYNLEIYKFKPKTWKVGKLKNENRKSPAPFI